MRASKSRRRSRLRLMSVATGRVTVGRNLRIFKLALTSTQPIGAGDYTLSVVAHAASSSIPARETMHLSIPAAPGAVGALLPAARDLDRQQGHADRRSAVPAQRTDSRRDCRRSRLIRSLRVCSTGPASRSPFPLPAAVREDADGSRWWTRRPCARAAGARRLRHRVGERRVSGCWRRSGSCRSGATINAEHAEFAE